MFVTDRTVATSVFVTDRKVATSVFVIDISMDGPKSQLAASFAP